MRRLRRSGVLSTSRRTSSRTPTSSSGVRSANDVERSRSSVDAAASSPSRSLSSPSSSPPAVEPQTPSDVLGRLGRASGGAGRVRGSLPIGGGAVGSPRLSAGSSMPSKTAEKTASNTGSWARSVTRATRQVQ